MGTRFIVADTVGTGCSGVLDGAPERGSEVRSQVPSRYCHWVSGADTYSRDLATNLDTSSLAEFDSWSINVSKAATASAPSSSQRNVTALAKATSTSTFR